MAADTIQIELTADDAKAQSAWARQIAHIEAFEATLDRAGKKAADVGDSNAEQGEEALSSFAKVATAVIGVGSLMEAWSLAASLVASEINNAIDRQKAAATVALDLPAAQRQLFANIGANSTEIGATAKERNTAALGMASQLSTDTGADLKTATEALSNAFSARQGDDTTHDAYAAAVAGVKASPDDAETAKTLGAAALRLRAGDKDITPEQAIGYMTEAGAMLPIENTQDVATNLPRVVAATKLAGGDEKFAASLYGAATTTGVDVSGDPGATFVTKFLGDLKKAVPESGSPEDQIKILQGDKKRGEKFFKGDFEARFKPFVESLITNGDAADQFTGNMAKAKSFAESGPAYQEGIDAANVSPQIMLARTKRILAATKEREQIADIGGATASVAREGLADIAKASGDSALEQRFTEAMSGLEALGQQDQIGVVKRTRATVAARQADLRERTSVHWIDSDTAERVHKPEDLQQADRLNTTLKDLDELLRDMRANGVQATVKQKPDDRRPPAPRDSAQLGGNGA